MNGILNGRILFGHEAVPLFRGCGRNRAEVEREGKLRSAVRNEQRQKFTGCLSLERMVSFLDEGQRLVSVECGNSCCGNCNEGEMRRDPGPGRPFVRRWRAGRG